MTTEDYIAQIEDRKKNKQPIKNVDWSQMPEGIDKARVADSLGAGLSPEYASEIKRRFTANQPINNLDYSQVKFQEGPPPVHTSDIVTGAIKAATMAPQVLAEGAMAATKAVTPSIQAAGGAIAQRPELQPLSAQDPTGIKGPTSTDPSQVAKDAAKAAGQTLAFPIRVGSTLQTPQALVQGMTTDALLKKGVNPYVAYASGMMAGVMADPITLMSAGEIASAYGAERVAAIQGRNALKSTVATMDVESANALAKFSEEASTSQAQDLAAQEAKMREMMAQKAPSMEGMIKNAGPEPHENLQQATDVYQQLANASSKETEHQPPTESSAYYPPNPPAKLQEWIGRSTKELGDLRFAQEVAAPTDNRIKDLFGTIRRYAGHQELVRSDAEHMMYELADYIPDATRRHLITMYADMGRAPTLEEVNELRGYYKGVKTTETKRVLKALNELMDQNLNLNDQEGAALEQVVGNYYPKMGEQAQKFHLVGESEEKALVPRLMERYGGPHLYAAKEDAEKGLFMRIITGKTRFAKPREFNNMLDAARNGYLAKTMDAAELLGIYHNGINKAASQRYLMNALEKQGLINWEGEGARIEGFEPTARMLEKNVEGETKKMLFTKSASSPFPEVQRAMRSIAEDQWQLFDNSWFPAMEKINRGIKMFNLYLQMFHPKALAAEAISKGYSPAKFIEGLKTIEQNPELTRSYIRNGLMINDSKDIGREIMRETNLNYKGPNPLKLAQKVGDIYTDWVFRRYMTGLKVYNTSVMVRRLSEMGIPEVRATQLAVDDSNRIFGGLNYGGMARSENMQRMFRLVAYAPDWTESKLRQMGGAVDWAEMKAKQAGKAMGMNVNPNKIGGLQRFSYGPDISEFEQGILARESRKYWVNMTVLATVTHLADQVNPFNRALSVDLSQETGFKDVKKLAMLAGMNPIYFTSKMSPLFRDITILSDPHMRYDERIKKILQQTLPIAVQPTGAIGKLISGDQGP